MYKVVFTKKSSKQYNKLPHVVIPRVQRAIANLSISPLAGKKLKDELVGFYVVRAWPYRVVYEVDGTTKTVVVISILHRQGAYR